MPMRKITMNQNLNYIEEIEQQELQLELLAEKQDYLDYIDADMEAFYSVKADTLGFDVIGL